MGIAGISDFPEIKKGYPGSIFDPGFLFKGGMMYLYWRINNDLNCLGESIRFHDPVFIRCYHQWIRQNAYALALAEGMTGKEVLNVCLN